MRMKHRSENYRFANTNSYLLIVTMVVSVLHMIFEYLALDFLCSEKYESLPTKLET